MEEPMLDDARMLVIKPLEMTIYQDVFPHLFLCNSWVVRYYGEHETELFITDNMELAGYVWRNMVERIMTGGVKRDEALRLAYEYASKYADEECGEGQNIDTQ